MIVRPAGSRRALAVVVLEHCNPAAKARGEMRIDRLKNLAGATNIAPVTPKGRNRLIPACFLHKHVV
jgi:hypothetical protein